MDHAPRRIFLALALAVLVLPGVSAADETPSAARVIVRGKRVLADAMAVGLWRPGDRPARPTFVVVIDSTPYTWAAAEDIRAALVALDEQAPEGGRWRIARLGERPSAPVATPGALAPLVDKVVEEDSGVRDTLSALERSTKAVRDKGATILYLADWHVEDEVGLEGFIDRLRSKDAALFVIGTEACFGRAWNDGFYPPDRGERDARGVSKMYADGVGRSPFGKEDPERPWHSGDTAWPHLPFHWRGTHWVTVFPAKLAAPPERTRDRYGELPESEKGRGPTGPEDLQDRMEEEQAEDAVERYWFPLSSGFGPYPLMRAAAETGGRYVLWSWNPTGRSDLVYDYSRVNDFGPDLRSRRTIHAEARQRALARALLAAWHEVANDDVRIGDVTAPLSKDGARALEMEEANGENHLGHNWPEPADHARFLAQARTNLEAIERALAILEAPLAELPADGPARRYHADARLFQHVLLVKRFQTLEALAAGEVLPDDAFEREGLTPGLDPETWVRRGADPEDVEPEPDAEAHDAERGADLLEARRRHLEAFRGTPFGEAVARNPVVTYRLIWLPVATGAPSRRSPSESDGAGPSTPRRPGSGGSGGPATPR